MPNRILRESILTSDRVNLLDASGERFYRRLMSVVDDYGRYDGRASVIRAACFPLLLDKVREADCSRWMAECQKAGLIVLYEADSKPYLQLLNLGEPRAKYSKYPEPCASARICAQTHPSVPYSPSPAPFAPTYGAGGGKESVSKRRQKTLDSLAKKVEAEREQHGSNGVVTAVNAPVPRVGG